MILRIPINIHFYIMSKRILVAGGGGFIGGHFARSLADQGNIVRGVDKKPLTE